MGRGDDGIKCIEVRTLLQKGAYEEALEVVETINIDRIKSIVNLKAIASVYERVGEYGRAKDVLLQSYDIKRTKMTVYRLAYLSIKTEEFEDAEALYEEFAQMAPESPDRYILRYGIDRAKNVDYVLRIATLQKLKQIEYTEEWGYELAKIYHKAGLHDECIRECKDLILWFGSGVIVDKARLLCKYHEEGRASLDAYGVFEEDATPEELQERRERFQADTTDLQAQAAQVEAHAKEQELRRQIDLDMEKTVDLRQVMQSAGDQFDLLKQEVHRVWGKATRQPETPSFIEHVEPVMESVSEQVEEQPVPEPIREKPMSRRETENMLAASLAKVMDKANRGELLDTPQVEEPAYDTGYDRTDMDPSMEYEQQDYGDMQEIFPEQMPAEPEMFMDEQMDIYGTEEVQGAVSETFYDTEASETSYAAEAGNVESEVSYGAEVGNTETEMSYASENIVPEMPYGAEMGNIAPEISNVTEIEDIESESAYDIKVQAGDIELTEKEQVQPEEPEPPKKMSRHERRNARRAAKREKRRLAREKKFGKEQPKEVLQDTLTGPQDEVEEITKALHREISEVGEVASESIEEILEVEDEVAETIEEVLEAEETVAETIEEISEVEEAVAETIEDALEVEEAVAGSIKEAEKAGIELQKEDIKAKTSEMQLQEENAVVEEASAEAMEENVETKAPSTEAMKDHVEMKESEPERQEEMSEASEPQVEQEKTVPEEDQVTSKEENEKEEQDAEPEKSVANSKEGSEEDVGLESDFVNEYGMVLWEYFEHYQNDTRLCEDVYRALEQIVKGKKPRNFIITCKNAERNSDFGRMLAKALKAIGVTEKSAARITAEKLNRMHLEQNYEKLKGSCLMVEGCRKMTADTAQSIMNMINDMPDDIIVFLCDARPYMKDLLDEYPMMKRYFPFDIAMK